MNWQFFRSFCRTLPLMGSVGLMSIVFSGCIHRGTTTNLLQAGPKTAELPLYRVTEGGEKIYVQVRLSDGKERLFLVDTGSSVSVLSAQVVKELALNVSAHEGQLVGLAGNTPWFETIIAQMDLGPFTLEQVPFAVDVPGIPTRVGLADLAGIIGNNVWSNFYLSIDYPANVLELARPGERQPPETAQPMFFNGQHVMTPAILVPDSTEGPQRQDLMLEIDTGARGLIVSGISGAGLEHLSTQGVEPLYGVGAGDNLPPSNFIRQTRRVAVQSVTLGGVTVEEPIDATWINFQSGGPQLGPQGMPGLIGHRILDGYNAHFDFSNQRFALTESTRKPEHHDVHEVSLAQLKHAKTANDLIKKARIQVWMEDEKGAQKTLQQFHDKAPSDPRGQILQSRLVRNSGDHAGALAILLELPVEDLVHERELIGVVNALWLTDESERAGQLALSATQSVPKAPNAWVALSDHHRYAGNLAESRQAINKANRLDENPDGHLLRRAWTASMEDDLFGAMTHLRRLLDLYPSGGVTLFFYHHIVSGTGHMPLLLEDVDRARARLHPGDGPLDFFSSTYRALGEEQLARTLMEEGRTRDCRTDLETYVRANCEAWYLALANEELELAQQNAETAVRLKPHRADFLDTLAMVQEARGDLEAAHSAANKAATMVPDDIYLLWQAARLNDALQKKQAG